MSPVDPRHPGRSIRKSMLIEIMRPGSRPFIEMRYRMSRYDGVVTRETFTFFALSPERSYEVRLRAKNEEGWSEAAKEFIFTTPK